MSQFKTDKWSRHGFVKIMYIRSIGLRYKKIKIKNSLHEHALFKGWIPSQTNKSFPIFAEPTDKFIKSFDDRWGEGMGIIFFTFIFCISIIGNVWAPHVYLQYL